MSEGNVAVDSWDNEKIEIGNIKNTPFPGTTQSDSSCHGSATTTLKFDDNHSAHGESHYACDPSTIGTDTFTDISSEDGNGRFVSNIRQVFQLCRSKPSTPYTMTSGISGISSLDTHPQSTVRIGAYITNINMRWSNIIDVIRSQRSPILT